MQITRNTFNINDINNWYESKELIVNKDYQREGGIWVLNARSYLLDTILNGFPFPKITIRQKVDLKTRNTVREIVDGQQRIKTINSYINNEFALTNVSENFSGLKYSDLEDEQKESILGYEVSVDSVLSASDEEVLEIFRRMNSYTLPLKPAEKRHASFQGNFKWFIKRLIKEFTPFIISFKVLTPKSISRMEDAELLTEFAQVKLEGLTSKSHEKLEKLYKLYDNSFENEDKIFAELIDVLNFLKTEFYQVAETGLLRPYLLHSLFSALLYNKFGFPTTQIHDKTLDTTPKGSFTTTATETAKSNVLVLLSAFDTGQKDGKFKEFVEACEKATNNVGNRVIRTKWFLRALDDKL